MSISFQPLLFSGLVITPKVTASIAIGTVVSGSDANSVLVVDGSNKLADIVLTDGQILIGRTGALPLSAQITGTTSQVIVTSASGSITLSLPQNITTTSSPTFANLNLAPSGALDTTSAGTLAIGTTNANIINIGNSGATVNIQGTTLYENVTQLQVKDPLITLNKGGGAGSASNSGIELEENSIITAYVETSADRNSWTFKAPNTAGIVTLTPGASGFIINQGSHDPVTLAAVGSTPNANAASLSGQILNLQPANASFPGVVSTTVQTFSGAKTFSSQVAITPTSNQIVLGTTNLLTITNGQTTSQTLTIPNITVSDTLATLGLTQTFSGLNTFSSVVAISATSNQLKLGTNLTISSPTQSSAFTLTIPNITANDTISTLGFTQTFTGINTFTQGIVVSATTNQLKLGTTNVLTITNAQTTSQTLTIPNITGTDTLATLGFTQSFSGLNTFTQAVTISATTNQLKLGTTNVLTITNAQTTSQTLTIPNITVSDTVVTNAFAGTLTNKNLSDTTTFIVNAVDATKRINFNAASNTTGITLTINSAQTTAQTLSIPNITAADTLATLALAQTFAGAKTFSSAITISAASAQLKLGTNLTISSPTQTSAFTLTVPNITAADTIATLGFTQSFTGVNTFTQGVVVSATTNQLKLGTTNVLTITNTQTTSQTLTIPNITGADSVVTNAFAATLTNKTIAAGSNTITGLTNTNLSGSAGITGANMATNTVANTNLAQMATFTIKGNNTGSTANAADLTVAQVNAMLLNTGDIAPTTFAGLVNNTANQTITGLTFATTISNFEVFMNIQVAATTSTYTTVKLLGTRKAAANWGTYDLQTEFTGDSVTGLAFTITSAGQVQVTVGSITGFTSASIKFRAQTLS